MLFLRQTQRASDFASDNRPFFDIYSGAREIKPLFYIVCVNAFEVFCGDRFTLTLNLRQLPGRIWQRIVTVHSVISNNAPRCTEMPLSWHFAPQTSGFPHKMCGNHLELSGDVNSNRESAISRAKSMKSGAIRGIMEIKYFLEPASFYAGCGWKQ